MDKIQRKNRPQPLPADASDTNLANEFANFFKEKIEKIVDSFPENAADAPVNSLNGVPDFEYFREVTLEEITLYIRRAPLKYCAQVDPIPTSLLMDNVDIFAPVVQYIVNRSIRSGRMPNAYKQAIVTPIIKKRT